MVDRAVGADFGRHCGDDVEASVDDQRKPEGGAPERRQRLFVGIAAVKRRAAEPDPCTDYGDAQNYEQLRIHQPP
jgi:hypothetical protein